MNRIDATFENLRATGQKAFIPFVTAGDPDLPTTLAIVRELAAAGAHLIELGIPFSDPIADGPVIQSSYTRALGRKIQLAEIFAAVRELTQSPGWQTPVVSMLSYTLVFRRGLDHFLTEAQEAGFSGAIVPDMPLEEGEELVQQAAERDFKVILLVTPTTAPERAARIAQTSSGFLYCVSVAGITGERTELPPTVVDQLQRLQELTSLPRCLGFGVSRPEQVDMLREHVDGVIVGSAMVRRIEELTTRQRPLPEVLDELRTLAQGFVGALNPPAS